MADTVTVGSCCCAAVNCNCSCTGPSYGPVYAGYPDVPALPPAPTPCNPSAPSFGDGWQGNFLNGTFQASQILDPCWSPFPPYDASQDWCNLPQTNWRNPDANGCDSDWATSSAASYANCNIKVWLGTSSRSNWIERAGESGCECASGSSGLEYEYRFFIINCNTGLWEDKTSTLVKRSKYRICSGNSVSSYGGADCSTVDRASALYYPAPIPPATLPGCNPLP